MKKFIIGVLFCLGLTVAANADVHRSYRPVIRHSIHSGYPVRIERPCYPVYRESFIYRPCTQPRYIVIERPCDVEYIYVDNIIYYRG